MSKNAWECTLDALVIMGDIDYTNTLLSKTNDISTRKLLSDKIDNLERDLFELKGKLKDIDVI